MDCYYQNSDDQIMAEHAEQTQLGVKVKFNRYEDEVAFDKEMQAATRPPSFP